MPTPESLPRIAIALGFPTCEKLIEHARREVASGETFLEFRLDCLDDPAHGVEAMRGFLRAHPDATVLATCRRRQNHGRFNGSVEDELRILGAAVAAGARAVDIEIETAEAAPAKLDAFRGRARLVLSYHNFEGTPALEAVLRRMLRIPADVYKVVTTARKPSDNLRTLALGRAHPRVPLILLAMGEMGFPSRVLSPVFGGLCTYAAPSSAEGTAAGQVAARQLRHIYRIEKLGRDARIYGVIADPVRHSISPAVHNRAFQARRIDAVYLPFLVQPAQLKDFMTMAVKLPVAGFSVTIPHKQKIVRYLDIVEPLARRIGAVNTVWRKAGKWRGANTDAPGVTVPLAPSAAGSLVDSGGGQRRRGAQRGLRAGGCRGHARDRGPQPGPRPRACQSLWRRAAGARAGRSAHLRRPGSRHAAGHVSQRGRDVLPGPRPGRRRSRHGVQPDRDAAPPARARAGRDGDPRNRDVPRTGGAAI
jgi:3-dehydroquinate dehydratase/shikimate dehydrogenase